MTAPFPPGSQVAAYLRDSGGEAQELSVEQQEAAIRAWCSSNNLVLTILYKDLASPGSTTVGRQAFQRMIEHFHERSFPESGIVLWKYSRFAREIDTAEFYKAELRRRGIILHSLQDNIPEGLEGRLIELVIDFMNARFLEDLSTDVRRGLHHLISQHGALGGNPPAGFKRQPVQLGAHRDGSSHIVHRWVPDPNTWELCRLAWQMRASGGSYRQIHEATHLYNSHNSYTTFFRNRLYLGELNYGDQVISDYVPALVDQVTWDQVQVRNIRNRTHDPLSGADNLDHPRRANSNFLLSGLLRCARCNSPMNGNVIKIAGGDRYRYYGCSRALRHAGCEARQVHAPTIEEAVLRDVQDWLLDPPNLAAQQLVLQTGQSDRTVDLQLIRSELVARQSVITRRLNNLVDAIAEAGHTPALLSKLNDLQAQQSELRSQVAEIDHQLQLKPPHKTIQELQALSGALRRVLATAGPDFLRSFYKEIIADIHVERNENIIYLMINYYHPPEDLLPPDDPNPTNSPSTR